MFTFEEGEDFDVDVPLEDSFLDRSRLSSSDLLRGGRGATTISFDETTEEGRKLAKLQRTMDAMRFRGISVLHQFQNIIDKQEACKNSIPYPIRTKAEDIIESFQLGRTINPQGFCWAIAYVQNNPYEKELFERAKHCNIEPLDILRYYRYISNSSKLYRPKITQIEIDPNKHVNTSSNPVKIPTITDTPLKASSTPSSTCTIFVARCSSIVPKWESNVIQEKNKTIEYVVVEEPSFPQGKKCTITTTIPGSKSKPIVEDIYQFERTNRKGEKTLFTGSKYTENIWECDSAETIARRFINTTIKLPYDLTSWEFQKSTTVETGFVSERYTVSGGPYETPYTTEVDVQRPSALGSNKLFQSTFFIKTALTVTERFLYDPEDPTTGELSVEGQNQIVKELMETFDLERESAIAVALNTSMLDFIDVIKNPVKSKLTLQQAGPLPYLKQEETLYFLEKDRAYDKATNVMLQSLKADTDHVNSTLDILSQAQTFVKSPTELNFISSRIEEVRYTLEGSFVCERVDTLELFNEMQVDMDVPVASVGKYHKVANGVISVPDEWVEDVSNETLRFFMRTAESENRKKCKAEDFADVLVIEKTISGATTTFDVLLSAGNAVPITELLHQFCLCLKRKPTNFTLKKRFGKGLFVMSQLNFEEIIFQDAVMNQPFIRNFITIDERYGIHKKRGGLKLQLKRNPTATDTVYASLIKKKVESGTDLEPRLFSEQVKKNELIYSIQISGREEGEITFMKFILEKCIQRMLDNYKQQFVPYYGSIVSNLKQVVPDPTVKQKIITESVKSLKEIDPVLFKSGYSRLCQGDFQVELATDSDQKSKRMDTMVFVRDADLNDQRKQFVYKCKNPSLFIGLKDNTNEDKQYRKDYPFIPCCFETNQKEEVTSLRYKYEKGTLPFVERQAKQKGLDENEVFGDILFKEMELKLKMPVLEADKIGKLEQKIVDVCNLSNSKALLGEVSYFRKGVVRSPRSVISCLIHIKRDLKQPRFHRHYVNLLRDFALANTCAQSGMNTNQALKILTEDNFINPIDWHQALCEIFQVNIYIWKVEKKGNATFVDLVPPKFNRFIIKPPQRFRDSVVLVMTSGGEFSSLNEPYHVEYLVERHLSSTSGKQILRSVFDQDHPLIRGLENCLSIQNKSYDFKVTCKSCKILHQSEDSVGKIRSFVLQTKEGKKVQVSCSPIVPFSDVSKSSDVKVKTDTLTITEAKALLEKEFGCAESEIVLVNDNGKCIGAQCLSNEVTLFIPCIVTDLFGVKSTTSSVVAPTVPTTSSLFQSYNLYIKIANCLKHFTAYLFSMIYSANVNPFSFKDKVEEFVKEHTMIDEKHQYSIESRLLTLEQTAYVKNKTKVIFTSESVRTRIVSNLKQDCIYRPESIFDIQYLKYIPDFYSSAADFKQGTQFTVYQTFLSYKQSRDQYKNIIYPILGTFQPRSVGSTFFTNSGVEAGRMFYCVPHSTIWDAIAYLGIPQGVAMRVYSISDDVIFYQDLAHKDNTLQLVEGNPRYWLAIGKNEDQTFYYTLVSTQNMV